MDKIIEMLDALQKELQSLRQNLVLRESQLALVPKYSVQQQVYVLKHDYAYALVKNENDTLDGLFEKRRIEKIIFDGSNYIDTPRVVYILGGYYEWKREFTEVEIFESPELLKSHFSVQFNQSMQHLIEANKRQREARQQQLEKELNDLKNKP